MGLEAAVEATVAFLDKAVKPVMVAGPKIRVAKAGDAFVELAEASGSSVQLRCRERARPAGVLLARPATAVCLVSRASTHAVATHATAPRTHAARACDTWTGAYMSPGGHPIAHRPSRTSRGRRCCGSCRR